MKYQHFVIFYPKITKNYYVSYIVLFFPEFLVIFIYSWFVHLFYRHFKSVRLEYVQISNKCRILRLEDL